MILSLIDDVKTFENYANDRIFQLIITTNVLESSFACSPNTYVSYLWKDYDRASTIHKLEILNRIISATDRK